MNQNITSIFYIVLGAASLIYSFDMLVKVIGLIFGAYWLFTGLSMRQPQPRAIIFMRSIYGRFFNRF